MWIIIIAAICVLALVAWRLIVLVSNHREPSRPIDRGHPHLTDVDPHGGDGA